MLAGISSLTSILFIPFKMYDLPYCAPQNLTNLFRGQEGASLLLFLRTPSLWMAKEASMEDSDIKLNFIL